MFDFILLRSPLHREYLETMKEVFQTETFRDACWRGRGEAEAFGNDAAHTHIRYPLCGHDVSSTHPSRPNHMTFSRT